MKKIIVVMMVAAIAISACAQKVNESQVPAAAKAEKNYPGIKDSWVKESEQYEVNFKKNGKAMSLLITAVGAIQETETDIPVGDLPAAIQTYVKAHYKNEKIKEAARLIKGNGDINYEAEVDDKDVIFDATGNFIKEAED